MEKELMEVFAANCLVRCFTHHFLSISIKKKAMRISFLSDPFHFPLLIAKFNLLLELYCLCSKAMNVVTGENLGYRLSK